MPTLNDCNIGDTFTFPGSSAKHAIVDLSDFIDEDTGENLLMAEVVRISTNKRTLHDLSESVAKILAPQT